MSKTDTTAFTMRKDQFKNVDIMIFDLVSGAHIVHILNPFDD